MDWIDLAQDSDRWQALVNAVMIRVPKLRGINGVAEDLLASQEGLRSQFFCTSSVIKIY
jgi:hypothetical protein